jgi:hypothetical protein
LISIQQFHINSTLFGNGIKGRTFWKRGFGGIADWRVGAMPPNP